MSEYIVSRNKGKLFTHGTLMYIPLSVWLILSSAHLSFKYSLKLPFLTTSPHHYHFEHANTYHFRVSYSQNDDDNDNANEDPPFIQFFFFLFFFFEYVPFFIVCFFFSFVIRFVSISLIIK